MLRTILVISLLIPCVWGQNLLNERIRKVNNRKRSVYFDKGIFHTGNKKIKSTLKAVRHSYSKGQGYERIVFDFSTNSPPKIYGHISSSEKRLYMDLFNSGIDSGIGSFGSSKFVNALNFYNFGGESVSVEMDFKDKVGVDVFYLDNPGRMVIDIKK